MADEPKSDQREKARALLELYHPSRRELLGTRALLALMIASSAMCGWNAYEDAVDEHRRRRQHKRKWRWGAVAVGALIALVRQSRKSSIS